MRTASVVKVPKVGWQGEDFTPNRDAVYAVADLERIGRGCAG